MESKGKKLKWGWRTSFLWWQFHLACLLRNEWIYPDFQYSLSAFTRISIIWHSLGKSGRPLASQNFYINRFFSSIYRHSNRCASPMRGWPCSLARTMYWSTSYQHWWSQTHNLSNTTHVHIIKKHWSEIITRVPFFGINNQKCNKCHSCVKVRATWDMKIAKQSNSEGDFFYHLNMHHVTCG